MATMTCVFPEPAPGGRPASAAGRPARGTEPIRAFPAARA